MLSPGLLERGWGGKASLQPCAEFWGVSSVIVVEVTSGGGGVAEFPVNLAVGGVGARPVALGEYPCFPWEFSFHSRPVGKAFGDHGLIKPINAMGP